MIIVILFIESDTDLHSVKLMRSSERLLKYCFGMTKSFDMEIEKKVEKELVWYKTKKVYEKRSL